MTLFRVILDQLRGHVIRSSTHVSFLLAEVVELCSEAKIRYFQLENFIFDIAIVDIYFFQ